MKGKGRQIVKSQSWRRRRRWTKQAGQTIGNVGVTIGNIVTTVEIVSYLPLTYFYIYIYIYFFFFQSFVPADFYFAADMSNIHRYIRYSLVFWAVRNKGILVLVDRLVRYEIDSPSCDLSWLESLWIIRWIPFRLLRLTDMGFFGKIGNLMSLYELYIDSLQFWYQLHLATSTISSIESSIS